MKYLYIFLLLGFYSISHADPACTLNSNNEITDTSDCNVEAEEYIVNIWNIGLCTTRPSAGSLSSCYFWDVETGDYVITPTTQSDLKPTSEIPAGNYTWLIVVQDPTFKIRSRATFASSKNGYNSTSGSKCWTRGSSVNLYGLDLSNNLNWNAECGTSFPSTTPQNSITYDSLTRHNFLASGSVTHPSGKVEDLFLAKEDLTIASNTSEALRMVSITPLSSVIRMHSGTDEGINKFEINLDRSVVSAISIDSTTDISGIFIGPVEVTLSQL